MSEKVTITFENKQLIKELSNKVHDKSIDKPFLLAGISIAIDSEMNYIALQEIYLLFKDEEKTEEIGLIHYAVKNTPTKRLSELFGTEIKHLLINSMEIAIDKANEELLKHFPDADKIDYITHESLIADWNKTIKSSGKDYARLN